MITTRSAKLMNLKNYGLDASACSADLVVLDATSPEEAVAELAPVLYAFKRGRKTVSRDAGATAPATLKNLCFAVKCANADIQS